MVHLEGQNAPPRTTPSGMLWLLPAGNTGVLSWSRPKFQLTLGAACLLERAEGYDYLHRKPKRISKLLETVREFSQVTIFTITYKKEQLSCVTAIAI